jgi:outer membrane protein
MKKTIKIFALLILGALSLPSQAQKFAFVDTDYILNQMPEYRSAQKQLDELSEGWQKEVEQMYAEVDKMYKDYQAEKVLLTTELQKEREEAIMKKEREVKDFQQAKFGFEGELFKKRQELIKPIQDKVFEAIQKIAKDNALNFIFDKSGQLLMLYTDAKYDKSDEVLAELGVVPTKNQNPGSRQNGNPDNNNLPPAGEDDENSNLPPR